MYIENPSKEVVKAIRNRLEKTNGYCPCFPIRDEDHICPCKKYRENGECCCGLYVKIRGQM